MIHSRFAALLSAPLLALTLASCTCDDHRTVRGNGPDEIETRAVIDLTRLSVSQNMEVYLTQGATPELRLEAPRNVLAVLRTETVGGELRIGTPDGINLRLQHPVRVYLTLPRLTALSGSGATHFHTTTGWSVADLTLTLSGASTADLNLTATGALRTEASGASRVTVHGTSGQQTIRLSGASALDAFDLTHTTADIDASGASQAHLTVSSALAVRASGASQVYYRGSPTLTTTELSGGSQLVKVD
ncbi:MAG: DUF2807 domain-containing protein [Hymenobacteraceae bacterium]|nr:DUF2807 domain-containing protein [Hymenobacteraceae bacterium]